MTPLYEGVDYSYGRPGGAALRAAGKSFAMRYIAHPVDRVNLMTAERADLHANDIAIGLILERGKQRALDGYNAGRADGILARTWLGGLAVPADRPVYFAVDFNAQAQQQPLINDYLLGAASVLGEDRIGVYGGYYLINRCAKAKVAKWFWQTYAWSAGHVSTVAHLLQYNNGESINGASVDLDRAFTADFGQWPVLPESDTDMMFRTRVPNGARAGTIDIAANVELIYKQDGSSNKSHPALTDLPATSAIHVLDDGTDGSPGFSFNGKTGIEYWVRSTDPGVTFTPYPDSTPYSQADIDAAVEADREKAKIVWQ